MVSDSVLSIQGLDFPPYSQRGVVQTLTLIQQAKATKRTVNGGLVNLAGSQFRKYASTLTNSTVPGVCAPSFEAIYTGQLVTVDCIQELNFASSSESEYSTETEGNFERPAVEGSIRFEDGFTYYRPVLEMMIMDFSLSFDEWGAVTTWSISLEEV